MKLQTILACVFLLYGIGYGALICRQFIRERRASRPEIARLARYGTAEGLVYFLSTMGFPDFVMNTLLFRRTGWVELKRIPPTLVAASVTPGAVIAFTCLRGEVALDTRTLLLCMLAIVCGSITGSRAALSLSPTLLRRIMAAAIACSMLALLLKAVLSAGAVGTASGLRAGQLCLAVPVVFLFGFLNMFGVPMKPAATALFLLMGLSPLAALSLMLVIGFMSPMGGSIRMYRSREYHSGIAAASCLFGSLGAALGSLVAVSLPAGLLNGILLCIMGFTIFSLLKNGN